MESTKQRILDMALDLFSKKGFSAVSIRDICTRVKIKESSIYYHFKNKQAILDELVCQFQDKATSMMAMFDKALSDSYFSSDSDFSLVFDYFFDRYLMDDFCNKIMRLLLIEQFNDTEIQMIYDRWMFAEPLAFQSRVFVLLMSMNVIKNTDADYLAAKFYAPIFLYAQRWLFSGELSEMRKNMFRREANLHIQKFFCEIEVK